MFFKGVDAVNDFKNFESMIEVLLLFYEPIFLSVNTVNL